VIIIKAPLFFRPFTVPSEDFAQELMKEGGTEKQIPITIAIYV